LGIVRQLPSGTHKGDRLQTDEADGVAVGPGAAKLHRCHLSSGTRHILDDHVDFVRQIFFQKGREHARLKVEATTGFKRNDDRDVSGRKRSIVFPLSTGSEQDIEKDEEWPCRQAHEKDPCTKSAEVAGGGRIPLLASPQGGVAERSIRYREASADERGRGGFPNEHKRKTTPAASASVASLNLLDDAATPPCSDARRGITRTT